MFTSLFVHIACYMSPRTGNHSGEFASVQQSSFKLQQQKQILLLLTQDRSLFEQRRQSECCNTAKDIWEYIVRVKLSLAQGNSKWISKVALKNLSEEVCIGEKKSTRVFQQEIPSLFYPHTIKAGDNKVKPRTEGKKAQSMPDHCINDINCKM